MPFIGFKQDFLFLVSWADYLVDHSPITIYRDYMQLGGIKFVNYPPLYLYILTGLARIYHGLFVDPFFNIKFLFLIKSVTVLFEIMTAYLLYFWVERKYDRQKGLWAVGLYFLNPAILYVSAYYGQLDAIFAMFLLAALIAFSMDLAFWCGVALSLALLMKLQTLPFLPLFFCFPLLRGNYRMFALMALGLICGSILGVAPYIAYGQLDELFQQCVLNSFKWGRFVSVGAFNLWYLHADPSTFDERIWGVLFGSDGMLNTNSIFDLLTYKNLGLGLFGSAFLLSLYGYWKQRDSVSGWVAAMHIALAFFMLPTKVHERYLFPYFVFAAPLAADGAVRRFFFMAFSLTYLINLVVVCPLFGESPLVQDINSTWGVAAALINVVLYACFISYEYLVPLLPDKKMAIMAKTLAISLCLGIFVFFIRFHYRKDDPYVLYLSELSPTVVEQQWPLIPPEIIDQPQSGYGQLKADLSTDDRQLQIGKTVYRYGLGAHAVSLVDFEVPGDYQMFKCYVGVDYEAMQKYQDSPDVATVTFTVWVNDQHRYVSPLTMPTTPPREISIELPEKANGTNRIKLVVDGSPDGIDSDHADWAMARVVRITKRAQ